MKKITNQIIYNLKKEKSSFISFGVIILITALILNCAAVLLRQVDSAYDTKFEKLSTATLNAIVPEVQNSSELEKAIDEAIAEGYVTFITGMAMGTDIWAAEIVLERKKENKDLHLICALPHPNFESRRSMTEKMRFNKIIKKPVNTGFF